MELDGALGPHGYRPALLEEAAIRRRLPLDGVRVARLAADTYGDSHALDDGEPLGTIVARGVEHVLGLGCGLHSRRALFGKAGMLADDLSAPALVLNLRASSDGILARTMNLFADAGEPFHISTRQLRGEPISFGGAGGRVVFACENPTIVAAAADVLGSRCAPLICTNGQARTATRELLHMLREGGVHVLYHGDFDWPGMTIARGLLSRGEVDPRRLGALDYTAAPDGPPLRGNPVDTPWDPTLAAAMRERGFAVHEEAVLATLLSDLNANA